MKKLVNNTRFFVRESKNYMAGEKVTPYRYVRAYLRFMWLSRNDTEATK